MPKTTPTMTVAPSPVPVGTTSITVNGTGFKPASLVLVDFSHLRAQEVMTDADGNFTHVHNYTWSGTGNAGVNAYIQKQGDWVKVATATFTVV